MRDFQVSSYKGDMTEFGTYLEYARNLKFEEEPDYDYCRGLMDKGDF